MLRVTSYLSTVSVNSGISLFWDVNNAYLGYLWYPLYRGSTMAYGRFLRGYGLNLYHLKYEGLWLLSIW